ncbi:MAG: hypothetical protein KGS61_21195, partial [Verrucomicrobia bacterium]|nr:hypothetical protein [Verrucomicrobiota bacterium]
MSRTFLVSVLARSAASGCRRPVGGRPRFPIRRWQRLAALAALAGITLAGSRAPAAPPRPIWARTITADSAGSSVSPAGICVDGQGDTIVAGTFRGSARCDAQTTVTAGSTNNWLFLAKYNPAGGLIWVKTGGSTNNSSSAQAGAVCADAAGNIYLGANLVGENNIDGVDVSSDGSWIAVAKLDPNGNVLWLTNAMCSGNSVAAITRIAVDAQGRVVAMGGFTALLTFGNNWTIQSEQIPSFSGPFYPSALLATLSREGAWTAVTYPSPGYLNRYIEFAAVAGTNVFYGGNSVLTYYFDTDQGIRTSETADLCYFGNVNSWSREYGGGNVGSPTSPILDNGTLSGLAVDEQGNVYTSGSYGPGAWTFSPTVTTNLPSGGTAFLAKFDPVGGTNLSVALLTNALPLVAGDHNQG